MRANPDDHALIGCERMLGHAEEIIARQVSHILMRLSGGLFILAFIAMLQITGCASPAQRVESVARQLGYVPLTLEGGGFILSAYRNNVSKPSAATLHVYIEGDGLPWLTPTIVSSDPTPRNPLLLELMALDPAPSLYLGRPCYFGHTEDKPCEPSLWTGRRYSALVVHALTSALRHFLASRHFERIVLVGHSGGGALALLMANRVEETTLVVTLAGNLDTEAWTRLHGFTPLTGSLNPAAQRKIRPFGEIHYLGGRDRVLPPSIFEPIARKRPTSKVILVSNTDHSCCWAETWREAVKELPH